VEAVKTTRAWRIGAGVFLVACCAFAQKVIQPGQVPCGEETVRPNLQLRESHRFSGELKDQSGAPFSGSNIILRKIDAKGKFVEYRTATTDKDGHFDLGTVEAGKYRFLLTTAVQPTCYMSS
jgi:hypothetical protein